MLDRLEGEAHVIGVGTDAAPPVLGAARVGRVLDDLEAVPPGDAVDLVEVGRIAAPVHHDDGLRPVRDGLLDARGIDVAGARIDIGPDDPAAGREDGLVRRGAGHGRRDDLVAVSDIRQPQRELEGGGAAIGREHVRVREVLA